MTDLLDCLKKVVKKERLLSLKNGKICLKGGKKKHKYDVTILTKPNERLVVFNVGENSHASFLNEKYYTKNCDYIFIQINSNIISFILCELKKSGNTKKALIQLKCSIPLMYYLKGLLDTHCIETKQLKLNFTKVLIINDLSQKTPISKQDKEDDMYILSGDEFSANELFELKGHQFIIKRCVNDNTSGVAIP